MDWTNAEYCPVYDATFKEWIEEQAISALASNMKWYKKADIKKEEEEFQKRIKKTDD